MGDAAEDAIQQGMDEWLYEGDFDICYQRDKAPRTCDGCGASGLEWRRSKKKWKLFDSAGNLHVCRPKDVFK